MRDGIGGRWTLKNGGKWEINPHKQVRVEIRATPLHLNIDESDSHWTKWIEEGVLSLEDVFGHPCL